MSWTEKLVDILIVACEHSCTRVRHPVARVALHVSQQISSESCNFSGVAAVSRYTPSQSAVAPVVLEPPGVSQVKLQLGPEAVSGPNAPPAIGNTIMCRHLSLSALWPAFAQ